MILQGKVMVEPQYLGRHNASGRDVYLLTLNSLNTLFFLPTSEVAHFACLCALNAKSLPPDEIGRFCSRLLDLGCAYFCAWGTESERVHDIMDEMVVGGTPPFSYVGCVMTTWHAAESLEDVLGFFLNWTQPDEEFAPNGCRVAVIISISGARHDREIVQSVCGHLLA